eukprot:IDg23412t1
MRCFTVVERQQIALAPATENEHPVQHEAESNVENRDISLPSVTLYKMAHDAAQKSSKPAESVMPAAHVHNLHGEFARGLQRSRNATLRAAPCRMTSIFETFDSAGSTFRSKCSASTRSTPDLWAGERLYGDPSRYSFGISTHETCRSIDVGLRESPLQSAWMRAKQSRRLSQRGRLFAIVETTEESGHVASRRARQSVAVVGDRGTVGAPPEAAHGSVSVFSAKARVSRCLSVGREAHAGAVAMERDVSRTVLEARRDDRNVKGAVPDAASRGEGRERAVGMRMSYSISKRCGRCFICSSFSKGIAGLLANKTAPTADIGKYETARGLENMQDISFSAGRALFDALGMQYGNEGRTQTETITQTSCALCSAVRSAVTVAARYGCLDSMLVPLFTGI